MRRDSAAIVANTSELLPEPDTPVNTVSRRFGSWTLTSLRLFSRAPCTRIMSWLSAMCRSGDCVALAMLVVSICHRGVSRMTGYSRSLLLWYFAIRGWAVAMCCHASSREEPSSRCGVTGTGAEPWNSIDACSGCAIRLQHQSGCRFSPLEPSGQSPGAVVAASATSGLLVLSHGDSAQFLDAEQVACWVADGAVADPVRLIGRLLDDLPVGGLQPLEGRFEVRRGQVDAAVGPFGHHLGDGACLVIGLAAARRSWRLQDEGCVGLTLRSDRDPAHALVSDIAADLESEGVAIESQRSVRVSVWEETCVNGDVHGRHARGGSVACASRFLIGLVTFFATHGGIPAVALAASRW